MSSSPSQKNSPKEKRSFTFFRTRTLSSSSNESTGGGGGNSGGGGGILSTSPRLSPRSIFDRVRKRSQSDAKSQSSVDHVVGSYSSNNGSINNVNSIHSSSNSSSINSNNLSVQQQQQQQNKKSNGGPPIIGNIIRKHLSHSISEENDEAIYLDSSNNKIYPNDFSAQNKVNK